MMVRFAAFLGSMLRYWAFSDFRDAARVVCLDCDLPFTQTLIDALLSWSESKHEVLRMNHEQYTDARIVDQPVWNVPLCGGFFGRRRRFAGCG